jgi:hypothetical protein
VGKNVITCEIAAAYTFCKLKAYFLLNLCKQEAQHEYISILKEETKEQRELFEHDQNEDPRGKAIFS